MVINNIMLFFFKFSCVGQCRSWNEICSLVCYVYYIFKRIIYHEKVTGWGIIGGKYEWKTMPIKRNRYKWISQRDNFDRRRNSDGSYLWALCRRPGIVCRRRARRSDSWTRPLCPTRWHRRRLSSRPTTTGATCVWWPADNWSARSIVVGRRRTSSDRQWLMVNGRWSLGTPTKTIYI